MDNQQCTEEKNFFFTVLPYITECQGCKVTKEYLHEVYFGPREKAFCDDCIKALLGLNLCNKCNPLNECSVYHPDIINKTKKAYS